MPASGLPVRWAAGVRSSASTKDIAGLRGRLWDSHSTEWWSSVPIQGVHSKAVISAVTSTGAKKQPMPSLFTS
ncbi:hypothetical protein R6Z07M_008562 [Ovis aries]